MGSEMCIRDRLMHNALFGLNLNVYRAPRVLEQVYPHPGYCATVLQKSQKFRVRVWGSYITYRSSAYGYGSVTDLTEVPGVVALAYITHRSSGQVSYKNAVPVPGYLWHWRTELGEVPGTGMNVVQNLKKFRVRVRMPYRTYTISL